MPWTGPPENSNELRRCIRDLVALWEAQQSTFMVIILVSVSSAYLAWHYTGQVWGINGGIDT